MWHDESVKVAPENHPLAAEAGGLVYPWPEPPAGGTTTEVAPGIRWLRMPLPFALNHINLWLLEDEGGVTAVDTGVGLSPTRSVPAVPRLGSVRGEASRD